MKTMKTTTDMKKEYTTPSLSVLELEYNELLLSGSNGEGSETEEGETFELGVYTDEKKKYSGDAL